MPGYAIHLAVGNVYKKNNNIKDIESFEKGIIAPDLNDDKKMSHYGPYSSRPDLSKFLQMNDISDSYNEGYFLHLVTDYLFYNKFLIKWNSDLYNDYNKLNYKIIKKYGVVIPKEIEDVVKYSDGKTSILNEKDVYSFIESVGKIDIRSIVEKDTQKVEERLSKIEFREKEV